MPREDDVAHHPPRRPRGRWGRTVLLGSLVLVCGAVIGSAITAHVLWGRFVHIARHPEHAPGRITEHLVRNLDLTDEQAERIAQIVAERQQALEAIHAETRPLVEEELELMRQEIEAVLTPEQAEVWNKRMERLSKRWLQHPSGRRPRGAGRHGVNHR